MDAWPIGLLTPKSQTTQLVGRVITGGVSLAGITQAVSSNGGGFWTTTLTDIVIHSRDHYRALRAWSAFLEQGAEPCIVPLLDDRFVPQSFTGFEPPQQIVPPPSGDYFSQILAFAAPLVNAHMTAAAALRATNIGVAITTGAPLVGGEHFSINHATKGWRLYRVKRVTSTDGANQAIDISPPLREATDVNTALEFDIPRCTMRLDPASAQGLEAAANLDRATTVAASFVEAF